MKKGPQPVRRLPLVYKRVTDLAGPVSMHKGFAGRSEELDVFLPGFACSAGGAAEYARGLHPYDEDTFKGAVFLQHGVIQRLRIG